MMPGAVRMSCWIILVLPGTSEKTSLCCMTISSRSCLWAGLRFSPMGTSVMSSRAVRARGVGAGGAASLCHCFNRLI